MCPFVKTDVSSIFSFSDIHLAACHSMETVRGSENDAGLQLYLVQGLPNNPNALIPKAGGQPFPAGNYKSRQHWLFASDYRPTFLPHRTVTVGGQHHALLEPSLV